MAATLRDYGYSPDGFKYWSYILIYTDDILIIDHEPKVATDYIASRYM
jgi:hypothetical protein